MNEDKLSPALALLQLTWRECHNSVLWSWARLNRCMQTALNLTIEAGFEFGLEDFNYISKHFKWGYWIGDSEGVYCHAVLANNMPAIKAFEHYRNRKPFIVDDILQVWRHEDTHRNRGRLAVRTHFTWQGERVTVTSFDDKNSKVIACTYKPQERDERGYLTGTLKVKHIYKLTHKELRGNTTLKEMVK